MQHQAHTVQCQSKIWIYLFIQENRNIQTFDWYCMSYQKMLHKAINFIKTLNVHKNKPQQNKNMKI